MSGNTRSSAPTSAIPASANPATRVGTTEEYWRQRFAAPAPETALPHDFPHPPRSRERGRPGRRTAALRTTANEATRLAAFVALLHRYGGAAATEMTVAYDGLPLRLTVAGGLTFAQLRAGVTAARAEAAAHRLPTADLLRLLAPEPGRGGALLCATGFGSAPWEQGGAAGFIEP